MGDSLSIKGRRVGGQCYWTICMVGGIILSLGFADEAIGCVGPNPNPKLVRLFVAKTEPEAASSSEKELCVFENTEYWVRVEWSEYSEGSSNADFHVKVCEELEGTSDELIAYENNIDDDEDSLTQSVVLKVDTTPYADALGAGEHKIYAKVCRQGMAWVPASPTTDSRCTVYEAGVELYRSSLFSSSHKLIDHPAGGGKPRSPKYILRKTTPIYVQVVGLGTDPDVQETATAAVKVFSETSPPEYVLLDLKETGTNTQMFRNTPSSDGELLYLAGSTSEGATKDEIEVQDEEVLTFKLRYPLTGSISSYVDSSDVKVDRAEFAGVDGTDTLDAAECNENMVDDDDWYSQGLYDKDHDKADGDDDKCVELGNKVDFMYIAGHASSGDWPTTTRIFANDNSFGLKDKGNANNLHVHPTEDADIDTWDEELEWLLLACCSTCKIDPVTKEGPGTKWVGTMDGTGLGHGIMGYRYGAPGTTTQTTDIQVVNNFDEELNIYGRTVKDAWIQANFEFKNADKYGSHYYSPLYAVTIWRYDNYLDCPIYMPSDNYVSQDSTDNDWTYCWIEWEWDGEDEDHVQDDPAPYVDSIAYP